MTDADLIRTSFRGLVPWTLANDAVDRLEAENQRLREALEAFANPQHWGITRDGNEPVPTWIGTYRKSPVDFAREALR